MNLLALFVDANKLGGWVRAAVGALLVAAIAKWPLLSQFMDQQTQTEIAVAVSGVAVGVWSHFAKSVAAGQATVADAAKKAAPLLMLGVALATAACTPQQINEAKQAAAASIDAACANLPNMDAQWQMIAPTANKEAQLGYQSAKATLVNVCNNRPLSDPEKQVAAVAGAVGQIAGLIAQYVTDRKGS